MRTQTNQNHSGLITGILMRFGAIAISFFLQGFILFLSAGRIDWIWAWVFLGIGFLCVCINGTIMLRTNPETIAERGRPREMKKWDKLIGGFWGFGLYLVLPLVAGLDIRFRWTQGFDAGWNIAGAVAYAAGLALFGWAMITNTFFSTAARIQSDRGQTVCQSGPYRFLRHPGYTGAILQSLATPILLGSLWALLPGVASAGLMVARTIFEDRMLQAELSGYNEYARLVRYRLLPGVW